MIKKLCLVFVGVCLFGILGIAIPKLFIHDSYIISKDKKNDVGDQFSDKFYQPIDEALILKTTIDHGSRCGIVTVNAYTFFGIKYATAELGPSGEKCVLSPSEASERQAIINTLPNVSGIPTSTMIIDTAGLAQP